MAAINKANRRKYALLGMGAVALVAAIGINRFMTPPPPPPPPPAPVAQAPQPPRVDPTLVTEILVARADLQIGQRITPDAIGWQSWPRAHLPLNAISRDQFPDAVQGMVNTAARVPIAQGDPMQERKVVRANDQSGLLAAMLPPGWRAVAIRLDPSGASSAGNFILPGDRVDIMNTPQTARPGTTDGVQVLLRNVKVIAINQAITAPPGQASIPGQTATLMLSPDDAIKVADAERQGRLSLVLRPLADHVETPQAANQTRSEGVQKTQGRTVETFRFGISGNAAR